ncbi:MAG: helix-turn-helix domain-containing protein [Janthinobacterium lividum]
MGDFARNWAMRQKTGSGSAKAVLMALAACADEGNGTLAFPSIETIEDMTELNEKTVGSALARLRDSGLIVDTGQRKGVRKQIKVYALGMKTPENGGLHVAKTTEIGGLQFAKTPETGGVQSLKTPDLGAKDPQNRGSDSLTESQERIAGERAHPGTLLTSPSERPDLVKKEMLGEGSQADPPDLVFDRWDFIGERHRQPGPIDRDVPRRLAIERRIVEVGLDAVLRVVEGVGQSDLIQLPVKHGRRASGGQANWLIMFDQVFSVGPRFRGAKLFERFLAAPVVLPPEPDPPTVSQFRDALVLLAIGPARDWLRGIELEFDPESEGRDLMLYAPTDADRARIEDRMSPQIAKLAERFFGGGVRVCYRHHDGELAAVR